MDHSICSFSPRKHSTHASSCTTKPAATDAAQPAAATQGTDRPGDAESRDAGRSGALAVPAGHWRRGARQGGPRCALGSGTGSTSQHRNRTGVRCRHIPSVPACCTSHPSTAGPRHCGETRRDRGRRQQKQPQQHSCSEQHWHSQLKRGGLAAENWQEETHFHIGDSSPGYSAKGQPRSQEVNQMQKRSGHLH